MDEKTYLKLVSEGLKKGGLDHSDLTYAEKRQLEVDMSYAIRGAARGWATAARALRDS